LKKTRLLKQIIIIIKIKINTILKCPRPNRLLTFGSCTLTCHKSYVGVADKREVAAHVCCNNTRQDVVKKDAGNILVEVQHV
jgi:hypothetical protein